MTDKQNQPLVSVVIPVYNESDNIRKTIRSLRLQSHDNIQFVIIDDGSEDDSIQNAKECLNDLDGQHVVLENATNLGQSFSRNRGAMHGDGKYFVFHDADDLSTPNRLKKQVAFLEDNPDVGVVGGAYIYINPNRNQREVKTRPTNDASIRQGMARECMINLGTAMFRREALFETNLFESSNVEGYELIVNIGIQWSLANIQDPIYIYRINEGSRSRKNQYWKKMIIAYRSYQSIKKLNLSYWNLLLQIGWFLYMNVPPRIQQIIRYVFSPTEERPLSNEEEQMIEELEQL